MELSRRHKQTAKDGCSAPISLIGRFRRSVRGATAVEFGIIIIPFLTMIFGIIELALIFFVGSVLSNAVSEAGRNIRVGSFQACGGAAEFKQLVCQNMTNLMNCRKNLRIDVQTANSFANIDLPDPGMSGLDEDDDGDGENNSEVDDGTYQNTAANVPVIVRGTFYYPLTIPGGFTRLESVTGSGRHIISSTTAFMTEPFPVGGSCGVTIDAE